MKNAILILILLCQSIAMFGQEQHDLALLETDTTWKKEIFLFPLHFAPEINYKGFEDARFPQGWGKADSSTFWSYVFAWSIDLKAELTENELEEKLKLYFDGLMQVVNKDKEAVLRKTSALFEKKAETGNRTSYVGKVRTYDAFRAKKPMTLNVLVDKYYCDQQKKSIVLFRFSPKAFGHDVWLKLKKVKPQAKACDL